LPHIEDNSEILILDEDTRIDLHLFGLDSGEGSEANNLFSFCNCCQTEGGKKVLRRRMERPWSSAQRIRATQKSLVAILGEREAFTKLPSSYVAKNVERYTGPGLPMVRQTRPFGFIFEAFALWVNDDRFYNKIVIGANLTCRLILTLRQFTDQAQTGPQDSELAPLIEEMRELLERPLLSQVSESGRWFWQKLRVDQVFRFQEKLSIQRLLQLVYEVEALVAMADVTKKHGFVLPCIESGPVQVNATGLVHPFLVNAVGNPLELNQEHRVLFLTGPNMAGKTTYLRAIATALYFAHLGMGVPAASFNFFPVQQLLTSISLTDNLIDGVSYFRAEALRVKAVAQAIADGYRVVAIMDEPFKGTNVKDAFDASLAILKRFAKVEDCLFVVSSHLIELSEQLNSTPNIDYQYFEAEEQTDRLRFDFRLQPGVSNQRLGMRVLREEGVFDLLDG